MTFGSRLAAIRDTRLAQSLLFALGVFLMFVAAPLASPLPGPGGLLIAAAGLTLVLRTSLWAKRRYVRFKRWQPKAGKWMDWGLRREAARRRKLGEAEARRRVNAGCEAAPPPGSAD